MGTTKQCLEAAAVITENKLPQRSMLASNTSNQVIDDTCCQVLH